MDTGDIYAVLTELFHDIFADDKIVLRPETSAADVEGWDSFTNLNLVVAVEDRFGIRMKTGEIERWQNVGDLVNAIAEKVST